MPMTWGHRLVKRLCSRKYSWSQSRGGCRFDPNHKGPCKPRKR
jgi:hypothetical protein